MAASKLSRIFALFGPTDDYDSPLWNIRLAPATALICILLAETVWKRSGFAHGICLGLAAGQLGILLIISFRITSITYKNPRNPNLQQLHLTR